MQFKFLPPYSSTLSVVERVWSIYKARFAKHLCTILTEIDPQDINKLITDVLEGVKRDI